MALNTIENQTIYLTFIDTKLNKKLYITCKDLKEAWNNQSILLIINNKLGKDRYKYIRIRKTKPNKEYRLNI